MKNQMTCCYSANFKRDYVALSAVVIFFLIVVAEITLAFSIPLYVRNENALALQVKRLNLRESFDRVRMMGRQIFPRNEIAFSERQLLMETLDGMAEHLRCYSEQLNEEDSVTLLTQINELSAALKHLQNNVPFSRNVKLECAPYLHELMKKSGAGK